MTVSTFKKKIRYYVSNNNILNGAVYIVDGCTNKIIKNITTGLGACDVLVGQDNCVYVANSSVGTISVINKSGNLKTFNITNNGHIDVDYYKSKIYISNGNYISIHDTLNGALIDCIEGFNGIRCVKLNKSGNLLFIADSGDNSLKIYSTLSLEEIAKIPTGTAPIFILLNEDESKAYISNAGKGSISIIELSNYNLIYTVVLGNEVIPEGLELFKNTLYVANNRGNIIPVDIIKNLPLMPISLGGIPRRIKLSLDKTKLYVTNEGNSSLDIIDPNNNTVIGVVTGSTINGLFSNPVDIVGEYESSVIPFRQSIVLESPVLEKDSSSQFQIEFKIKISGGIKLDIDVS